MTDPIRERQLRRLLTMIETCSHLKMCGKLCARCRQELEAALTAGVPPAAQQALDALRFAHGAILDAIGLEDGLDASAGEAVLNIIRDALTANGAAPPDWPDEDQVVPRLPVWTAEALHDFLKSAGVPPEPSHEGTCNPFSSPCGARFCAYEEMAHHAKTCSSRPSQTPEPQQ